MTLEGGRGEGKGGESEKYHGESGGEVPGDHAKPERTDAIRAGGVDGLGPALLGVEVADVWQAQTADHGVWRDGVVERGSAAFTFRSGDYEALGSMGSRSRRSSSGRRSPSTTCAASVWRHYWTMWCRSCEGRES